MSAGTDQHADGLGVAASGLGPWRSGSAAPDDLIDPATTSVAARFAEIARRQPERTAIRSPDCTWTYAQLGREVERIAGGLQRLLGPGTGHRVALIADHDAPLVAAVLGVITAGHVVVILDPAAPEAQTADVIAEAEPRILLHDHTTAEAAGRLASGSAPTHAVALDDLHGTLDSPPTTVWSDPIMLAFTSGTSGTPKAAVISNGVLMNLVRGSVEALGIGPDDTMPMLFPTALAVAAYPMFLPLLNGGCLATLDVRSLGLAPVADFLVDQRVTLAYMAPTVVRFLVDSLADRRFPDLRMIALGGEVVDADILKVTAELFGCEHVAVGYGTTETGVVSLAVFDRDSLPSDDVHCGFPVNDVDLAVLDDAGRPAEEGETGEVAVVSRYMFDGYRGHPELDRQVLSTDPRGGDLPCYRTGDMGRLGADGTLHLSGRVDTKVKVRGRFVVLGDVEADIQHLEQVTDAAVVARSVDGITELVAYVVPSQEGIDAVALRSQLLEHREPYRVPSRWLFLDELPRLPNGKIDRRALPDPDALLDVLSGDEPGATAPASGRVEMRGVIRSLWQMLLPAEAVGDDDDFTELGGDSLLAAQMLVMLERRIGITVPMGELTHARTVRSLAEVVVRLQVGGPSRAGTAACVQRGNLAEHPRLWFVHDLQGSAYRVRHFAAALGADVPVWSFESPLLAGEPNRDPMLESFAARYVADLRSVQPEGPYWLAGYSFGGICAYEMARQLHDDGHEVAFVGVVDVGPGYRGPGWSARRSPLRPWFGVAKPPPPGSSVGDRVSHYRHMVAASPLGAARHLMVRSGVARVVDPFRFRSDLRHRGRVRPEWRLWYAWEEHWRMAATSWDRAARYPGRVDLFWADRSASADATMGWGPLVGDLRIHRFEGDHEGILEPRGADELARVLGEVVRDRSVRS